MSDTEREQEQDEPNEFGFSGGATGPEPERAEGEGFGESIAVPAGDITSAINAAIEEVTDRNHSGAHEDSGPDSDEPSKDR